MNAPLKLKDKVAIVTGGGRGIGRAIAEAFAREGAKAVVTSARQRNEIEQVASTHSAALPSLRMFRIRTMFRSWSMLLSSDFGRIDILVNNAARGMKFVNESFMTEPKPFWEADPDMWRMVIDTNISGVFLMTRAVIPHMLRRKFGRIINISSYSRNDEAQRILSIRSVESSARIDEHIWAQELEGTGITLNVLLPGGATNTGMIRIHFLNKRKELIDPAIMGPPAVYLASDDASGINGQRIIAVEWKEEHNVTTYKKSFEF